MVNLVPLFLLIAQLGAQATTSRSSPDLTDLAFLSGCWEGNFQSRQSSGTIEEFYTTPSQNVMLGTTRYILDGRTVQYEFTAILQDSSGIFLRPYPGGTRSPHDFHLTQIEGQRAVFENPEHDYPKRILYWSTGEGSRVARIDAGADDPEGMEWKMRAAPCPGWRSEGIHEHD